MTDSIFENDNNTRIFASFLFLAVLSCCIIAVWEPMKIGNSIGTVGLPIIWFFILFTLIFCGNIGFTGLGTLFNLFNPAWWFSDNTCSH